MNFLLAIFLLITFFLFLIEIVYELYLTAFLQVFLLLLLFYNTILNKRGILSRLLILMVFLLSYPIQVVIIASGNSTLSGFDLWTENNFSFKDNQVALVIMVSSAFYFMIIFAHNLCFYISNKNIPKKLLVNESSFSLKKKFSNVRYKINSKLNIYIYLWIIFLILGIIIVIQNKYGWGIWGLPPYQQNIYRLIGITFYLREIFIPVIIFFLLFALPKINLITKLIILSFSFIVPLISLSKVTLIFYYLLIVFTLQHNYIFKKSYKKLNLRNILIWIFLLAWGFFIYYWMNMGRIEYINDGLPIKNQFFLMLNLEIFDYELFKSYIRPQLFYSLIERFLGFQGLAASLYFEKIFYYEANFLAELALVDPTILKTNSAKMLISSTQRGGLGMDWISKFILMGYFMIIPILMIFVIFFLQMLIIKNSPYKFRVGFELVMMIIFLRFAIDGNFIMIKTYAYVLIFILIFLIFIKKLRKKSSL